MLKPHQLWVSHCVTFGPRHFLEQEHCLFETRTSSQRFSTSIAHRISQCVQDQQGQSLAEHTAVESSVCFLDFVSAST